MSAEAPWLDAPIVEDDPEPWKSAPIVEDPEQPWLAAPVVGEATQPAEPASAVAVSDVRELAKRKALRDYGPPLTPEEEVTLKKAQGRSMMNSLSAGEYKAPVLTPEQQRHVESVVNTPRLDVAEPQGAIETVRRALTPLLGPTEGERTEEMVPWGKDEQGNQLYVYKPLGNRLEQEQGLMTPFAKVEPMPAKEGDTALGATGKAVFNTAAGLVNSVLSPAGAMLPVAGQVPAIGRTVGGAFAADMATHIPEQLVQMTEGKTLQEQIEGGLGAATSTLMALAGGAHATGVKLPPKPSNAGVVAEATTTKPTTALDAPAPVPLASPAIVERAPVAGEARPVIEGDPFAPPDNFAEYYTPGKGPAYEQALAEVRGFLGLRKEEAAFVLEDAAPREAVELVHSARNRGKLDRGDSPEHQAAYIEGLDQAESFINEVREKHGIKPRVEEPVTETPPTGSRPAAMPAEAPLRESAESAPGSLPERTTTPQPAPPEVYQPIADALTQEAGELRMKPYRERDVSTPAAEQVDPAVETRIRQAAQELAAKTGFPSVKLADVLERAGFDAASPESMAQAKGAIMRLAAEDKVELGGGDWSLAAPREKAWAVMDRGELQQNVRALEAEVRPEIAKARELFPEQADVAAPKLDVKRSPFALGISPDNKAVTWLSKNVKRLFTATGDLPKETFESWIDRNGFVKAESRQTAYATRDLYNALKDEFKISTTETLTKGFEKVPPAFVKEMNRALLGEVDINTLPEKVRAPLQAMRQHIDALSFKMLKEGVVPDSLQAKVADNLGVYMTRSYRIFDDPKWAEKIPNDVRNRARDFIYSNLKKTDPTATPETANAVMQAMLQDWKDQGSGALVKSGGKIGSKDLTSFIARKDIPKVLRDLMGEYSDPTINYARSVTKMANLIGSQRFLNEVRAQGAGKFLFEDGKQPASHSALIAAEGSDVMAPLNGLRTTPEIATAFKEFGKTDPIKNPLARVYFTLSGLAKASKTVGSAMTQARNILGQAYFFGMNGHFDMRPAAGAVKAVLADLGARDTPAGRAAYQRYLRLGIVDQSAKASELRDIIRDTGLNDPGTSLAEPGAILAKTAKKLTVDAAARAYQVADDLGKIIGFENELVRQREIHPEWSEATLEGVAAERIRNTYPTYSSVPKAVKNIRVLPFSPFASFASETFRTAYHNLRYTIEDLRSEIPAQRKAGAQRLAGQLAVVGSGYALSAISQAMLGMNAHDEDDARRFMAPWDKDSQIMFTGKGDGQARYVNLSYTNPYSYLTDPVVSVASGLRDQDQLDEVMIRSMGKLIQPFTSEDIAAGALADVLRNTTKTGRRVYNPGDTPAKRWEDISSHLLKTIEPGTLTRVKGKIIPAIKGETDRSGRKPELSNEILNELTGFKQQTIDYQQAVGFKAREFKKADDDADTIFREVAGRRGTVKPDDITDAYKRATRSKFNAWQDFYRDVQAARRRGVSDSAIRTAVEARGVSGAEAGAVMSGKFIPPRVSPSLGKQMKEANRSMPNEAVTEMRRAEKLVLSGSF